MMHSSDSTTHVPKRSAKNLGSVMLHEIFSDGTNVIRRRLLPVIALLVMFALCLPVLLVNDFDSNGDRERKRRRKRRIITNSIPVPTPADDVWGGAALVEDQDGDDAAHEWVSDVPRSNKGDDENVWQLPPEIDTPLAKLLFRPQDMPSPLPPYTMADVLRTVPRYHSNVAILVYDPKTDKFVIHYSTKMRWTAGCHKLITSMQMLVNSIRLMFPDRFDPSKVGNGDIGVVPELAMAVSSGDYPALRWNQCLRDERTDCDAIDGHGHIVEGSLAPILHFGSVFQMPLLPTITLAMPMPQMNHLHCFHYWTLHRQICNFYLPRSPSNPNGLVFGDTLGLEWDDLTPQVVWRGTDFSYLQKLLPGLRRPDFDSDIASSVKVVMVDGAGHDARLDTSTRHAAVNAMRSIYNELIPRWKGVVWTAEAERDADRVNNSVKRKVNTIKLQKERARIKRQDTVLPWCNIKFAGTMHTGKNTPASEVECYRRFVEYGIPVAGESMTLETLGTFKYQIDIGGGGGTTWSGTLEKLALPGVLFHHVTPTKDYLHDLLLPWVHYIPVVADLSDLRERYEWAESHPHHARRISEAATALVASFRTSEGFEALHRRFYEEPLRQVVEAYVPLGGRQEQGGEEEEVEGEGLDGVEYWQEAMLRLGGEELRPIMQCGGYYHHDCERLVDDIKFKRSGVMTAAMEEHGEESR